MDDLVNKVFRLLYDDYVNKGLNHCYEKSLSREEFISLLNNIRGLF